MNGWRTRHTAKPLPSIMGIVNVTPDSFSDGGAYLDPAHAIKHGERLIMDGADILDIGGESSRPGAVAISADEECARVIPVIRNLRARNPDTPISIDTRKTAVMAEAISAGATFINDTNALADDGALELAARHGVPVCLMHAAGKPQTMQDNPQYADVVAEVYDFLAARCQAATSAGIAPANIYIDPGFGFGKTLAHNIALFQNLSLFATLGKVLVGVSRKRMLRDMNQLPDTAPRLAPSIAAALAAHHMNAAIIRVHDVAETVQAIQTYTALTA